MIADQESEVRTVRIGLPIVTYVIALFGALYVWHAFAPRGLWLALTLAPPVLALLWVLSLWRRAHRMCGPSKAMRTYLRRFIPLMVAYVVLLIGAVWLNKAIAPAGPLAVVLAILPALPLAGVIWALGRLLTEETDEYLRSLTVRQFLFATGFLLVIACIWGFLEAFGQVPHVPMYWTFIIWCAGLGVGSLINELRS